MNEYEKELKKFDDNLVKPKAVLPLVLVACIIILVSYFLGYTFTKSPIEVATTVGGLLIFSVTTFFPKLQFSRAHITWLVLYHFALIGVAATIMPIFSPFLMFWVVLTYVSQYFYKKSGLFISISILIATLAGGMAYQKVALNQENLLIAGIWFGSILSASLVFSSITKGTLQNRGLLANKMIRAEYEHQRILSLINGMSDSVIATDENGIINAYNSATLELLNTNTGFDNQKIDEVLKLTDINHHPLSLIEYSKALKSSFSKADFFVDFGPEDRRTLEINISRTTLFSTVAQQKGYTFVIRDVTEEKSLREERDDFVSVVSHELRTPIAIAEANTAMAQLQAKSPKLEQEKINQSLDNAHKQIVFLSEMINDLATLSKAETEKNKIEIEKFSVDSILKELDSTFRPKADEKGLSFTIKTEPGLEEMNTSRLYVKDILQNLTSNAVKYTSKGGVEIQASQLPDNKILFAIKDTGTGITKAEQEKLFQKFWRSEDIHTRETEGTGLGLYIASKLSKQLGAEIKVESTKGKGSTFFVTIPVKISKGAKESLEIIDKEQDKLNGGT